MYFLYDDTGEFQGTTIRPQDFPELNTTTIAPPSYDEFDEQVYFIDGAWEIRTI